MKRLMPMMLLFLLPLQVFAVSNFRLNGGTSYTITSIPDQVVFTCDLAQTGNELEVEIYLDVDGNNSVGSNDLLMQFSVITDGIGWIRDPGNPDEDITGDETGPDKKIQTTIVYEKGDVGLLQGQFIVRVKDEDGSTASGLLKLDVQAQPPIIQGKVTEQGTATPIQGVLVFAEGGDEEDSVVGITDENGDYQLSVTPGTWGVMAVDYLQGLYQSSDSVSVTVGAGETKTQNIQMKKYTTFVDGTIKKEDGTPVPDIMVFAGSASDEDFSFAHSDNNGYYRIGVSPGQVAVMVTSLFNPDTWPEGYFVEQGTDTVQVNEGQTVTVNFILKPLSTFIEGTCTEGGVGLADVEITAMSVDFTTFQISQTTAVTGPDGKYKLGVLPGMVTFLSANKEGYEVTDPAEGGYMSIQINEGQTISGKDFVLRKLAGGTMSISGTVTHADNSPAGGVYVVAINDDEQNRNGFRILFTDGSGGYKFDDLFVGFWKVGVFKAGYESDPPMRYEDLWPGFEITDADFKLGEGTGVVALNDAITPQGFFLEQNYPNPFRPGAGMSLTNLQFYLDGSATTEISIFNVTGQLVKRINGGILQAGKHGYQWDGRDETGEIVPTGIYFYHVKAGDQSLTKRMLIIH